MRRWSPRRIYEKYAGSVAFVDVEKPNEERDIGTAFHVGEGVFVTAAHVLRGNRIIDFATTEHSYIRTARKILKLGFPGVAPYGPISVPGAGKIIGGPFFHPNDTVDIAAVVVEGLENIPAIPLGDYVDDRLDTQLIMTKAIVMGYPRIPHTRGAFLVTSKAEVCAIVDKYSAPHPHFIVSCMARGGFSGGVAISVQNFALGVVTESLFTQGLSPELGYMAVLSVEPVYECLAHHKILPAIQKEGWGERWDSDRDASGETDSDADGSMDEAGSA